MSLVNIKIRVKEYSGKGWAVEVQKEKTILLFFKKKYWIHIISAFGIDRIPWYYKNKQTAIEEAKKLFEYELLKNN